MRNVILYSAISLDGFIARNDGSLDWLYDKSREDYGYDKFYESIDTTLMGFNTYQEILKSDVSFPYLDKTNYVFSRSHSKKEDSNQIRFVKDEIETFVEQLKSQKGKDIWLVSGGEINTAHFRKNLIDQIILTVHPIFIGEGIPLFRPPIPEKRLHQQNLKKFKSGKFQLYYKVV